MGDRRVALVADARSYVGPPLARALAQRGHDLVVGPVADGLVEELQSLGARVVVVDDARELQKEGVADRLVAGAMGEFGRLDAAVAFPGQIVIGKLLDSKIEDLHRVVLTCLEAPYRFLTAVAPPMVAAGSGQILLCTSAAGSRPTRGAAIYSSVRAGANMMALNLADEIASKGVSVNAVGTNFMDFPEFHAANGTNDPQKRAALEARVPLRRMGTLEEFASFACVFLDGTAAFQTGQSIAFAGGWA
jgi:3-oxoacyl-[acyl-carrier protein] reductase